jgi:8-oxo-dGTP pyrophosphatase MutT (NUDIX family)
VPTEQERFRRWLEQGGGEDREAIPAATVILLRDTDAGLETLMLRRNSKLAFGGMWVFPGGRVDADDHVSDDANTTPDPHDFDAARRAAVREAQEEAGLAVDLDKLVALSHWTPPPQTPKRFATWFFVAPAPAGAVTIDDGEIHEHQWMAPAEAIARRDRSEIELAPPTWVTLHTLARSATVADALADAAATDPLQFVTRIAFLEDRMTAMWAGDAGYESGEPETSGPRHRLVMSAGTWSYERDL